MLSLIGMLKRAGLLIIFLSAISLSPQPAHAESSVSPLGYVSGGLVGTVIGFGTGHILQGRYFERGYVFTLGELASVYVFAANLCIFTCTHAQDMWAGAALASFVVFKFWEIGNLWFVPKVALLKSRDHEGLQIAMLPTAPQNFSSPGFTLAVLGKF